MCVCVCRSVDVEVSGKTYKLEAHMVNIKHQQRTVHGERWCGG